MKIHKIVNGINIITEYEKIKDYGKYILYQVYLIQDNKRIPIYKECYNNMQLKELEDIRTISEVQYAK